MSLSHPTKADANERNLCYCPTVRQPYGMTFPYSMGERANWALITELYLDYSEFHQNSNARGSIARRHTNLDSDFMLNRNCWLDRSHWYVYFTTQTGAPPPEMKYAPHFDDHNRQVPLLDGFLWHDREAFWSLEHALASPIPPTAKNLSLFNSKNKLYNFAVPDPQNEPHRIQLDGGKIWLWNVGRGEMAAYRDVCAWALDAAYAGRTEELKDYVKRYGRDILHYRGRRGTTPLHKAVENLHTNTVAALLELGADPNALCDDGLSPLLALLRQGRNVAKAPGRPGVHHERVKAMAQQLVAAGAKPRIHFWFVRSVVVRTNKRIDGCRVALVGRLRLHLALSFRLCSLPQVSVFNADVMSVIASFLLPQDGICEPLYIEMAAASAGATADHDDNEDEEHSILPAWSADRWVWRCTASMKSAALAVADKYERLWTHGVDEGPLYRNQRINGHNKCGGHYNWKKNAWVNEYMKNNGKLRSDDPVGAMKECHAQKRRYRFGASSSLVEQAALESLTASYKPRRRPKEQEKERTAKPAVDPGLFTFVDEATEYDDYLPMAPRTKKWLGL